eukprot:2813102-Amphidinium_carterae.2
MYIRITAPKPGSNNRRSNDFVSTGKRKEEVSLWKRRGILSRTPACCPLAAVTTEKAAAAPSLAQRRVCQVPFAPRLRLGHIFNHTGLAN